jgi:tetratricopeptide (TPR) repeat protein
MFGAIRRHLTWPTLALGLVGAMTLAGSGWTPARANVLPSESVLSAVPAVVVAYGKGDGGGAKGGGSPKGGGAKGGGAPRGGGSPKVSSPRPSAPKASSPRPSAPKASSPRPSQPKMSSPRPKTQTPKANPQPRPQPRPEAKPRTSPAPRDPKVITVPSNRKPTVSKPASPKPTGGKPSSAGSPRKDNQPKIVTPSKPRTGNDTGSKPRVSPKQEPRVNPNVRDPKVISSSDRPTKPTASKPGSTKNNLPKVVTGGSGKDRRSNDSVNDPKVIKPSGLNPNVKDPTVIRPGGFSGNESGRGRKPRVINDPAVINHGSDQPIGVKDSRNGSRGFGGSSLDGIGSRRTHRPISHASCGHSVCGGRSACVYGSSFHGGYRGHYRDPQAYGYCAPVRNRWCDDDHWSLSFGFYSGGFSFGYGYSSGWPHYPRYYYPRYSSFGYCGYPSYSWSLGYSNICEDPCWDPCDRIVYYRPLYGCYRPRYSCYRPYFYGSYFGGYSSVSYTYLYDDDDDEPYSSYDAVPQGDSIGDYAGSSGSDITVIAPNDGWELLAQGDAREARRSFDRAREAFPNDGLPRVGYAIACALLDRGDEAVSEMRRVIRDDPDALDEVPQDEALMVQVQHVIDLMNARTQERSDDADAYFMIAALRYVMDEDARAYLAIDMALDRGDRDRSARQLKSMIQQAIERDADQEPVDDVAPSEMPDQELQPAPANPPATQPTAASGEILA